MTDQQYKKVSKLYTELIETISSLPIDSEERKAAVKEAVEVCKMLSDEEKGRVDSEDKRLRREIEVSRNDRDLDIKNYSVANDIVLKKQQTRSTSVAAYVGAATALMGTAATIVFAKKTMDLEKDGTIREPMTKRLAGSIKWPNFKL